MAVTEAAPLGWHQARLAVDDNTANARLELNGRFEPDVVFEPAGAKSNLIQQAA
jgi:hypothetical protein